MAGSFVAMHENEQLMRSRPSMLSFRVFFLSFLLFFSSLRKQARYIYIYICILGNTIVEFFLTLKKEKEKSISKRRNVYSTRHQKMSKAAWLRDISYGRIVNFLFLLFPLFLFLALSFSYRLFHVDIRTCNGTHECAYPWKL